MLTIPKPMLNALNLSMSAKVNLSIKAGKLTIDPVPNHRHGLDQLLAEWKPVVGRLPKNRDWTSGRPVGRELV
ncbi:MAG TPA: hypothetical protein VNK48_11275 [Xanthobacteraceae bacterium]|nr:hypothetical protein [Xanthobacteraceae bacterium]